MHRSPTVRGWVLQLSQPCVVPRRTPSLNHLRRELLIEGNTHLACASVQKLEKAGLPVAWHPGSIQAAGVGPCPFRAQVLLQYGCFTPLSMNLGFLPHICESWSVLSREDTWILTSHRSCAGLWTLLDRQFDIVVTMERIVEGAVKGGPLYCFCRP